MALPPQLGVQPVPALPGDFGDHRLLGELEVLLCPSHLPLISNQSCLGESQLICRAQGGFFVCLQGVGLSQLQSHEISF